jgi:diaminopimelate decarboxylase
MLYYDFQKHPFFNEINPFSLIKKFGSPLYVYNENILRQRCKDLCKLVSIENFKVNYSPKANGNLELLKIIKEEGCNIDATSQGEIFLSLKAGFNPEEILFIANNINKDEMKYAIDNGIICSLDSISQFETYGELNPNSSVFFRFNPGIGAGHHKKVITAGKNTKFGIGTESIPQLKIVLKKYNLKIIGINQHIGSLFLDPTNYIDAAKKLLEIAREFNDLKYIDFGGGFGVPYINFKEKRLDLKYMGEVLTKLLESWQKSNKKDIIFKIEPGRYIVAESGLLIGEVNAIKENNNIKYIGTDIGFNVLMRPVLYNSYHEIEVYRDIKINSEVGKQDEVVTFVGNICETGDILAENRSQAKIYKGDLIGVCNAGAYGFSMSSNYNGRLKPAEVLIKKNNEVSLIRKRDTLESLILNFL